MQSRDCPDGTPVSIHRRTTRVSFTTGWAFKLTTLMPCYHWFWDVDKEWRIVFKTQEDYRLLRQKFLDIPKRGTYFRLYSASSCYEIQLEDLTKEAGKPLRGKRRGKKHRMRMPEVDYDA